MLCKTRPNCTGFPSKNRPPGKEGLADIAGIGVVWSFGITAAITVLFAMPITLLSLLDLFPRLQGLLKIKDRENFEQRLKDSVEHITLGLSDQQLITGLSILTIGYTKHCTIISRHFWIVFDLSFFSAVTHLASLLALRSYFTNYRRLRDFRVFLMLCNYIMLLVAAILTFRNYKPTTRNYPIQCTFNEIRNKQLSASGIYTTQMVLLTLVFFWQLVMMYVKEDAWKMRHKMIMRSLNANVRDNGKPDTYDGFLKKRIRTLENAIMHEKRWTQVVRHVVKLRYLRKRIYTWLWSVDEKYSKREGRKGRKSYEFAQWAVLMLIAPPSAVVWLVILTLWALGVGRLIVDRQWAIKEENMWTFGQVLPMLIMVLPFFTVTEELQEQKSSDVKEEQRKRPAEDKPTHAETGAQGSQDRLHVSSQEAMSPSERV